MKYVGFGVLNNKLSYILLLTIFKTLQEIFKITIKEKQLHVFYSSFFMFVGEIIGGCLSFVYFPNSNKNQDDNLINATLNKRRVFINKIEGESMKKAKKDQLKLYLLILCATVLDYMSFTLISLASNNNLLHTVMKIIHITFACLFSYCLLYYRIFRHHILAIILIIIGIGLHFIDSTFNKEECYAFIILLISFIIIALKNTIEKVIMTNYYCNPLKSLLIEGVFGLFISSIVNYSLSFITISWLNDFLKLKVLKEQYYQLLGQSLSFWVIASLNFIIGIFNNIFIFLINDFFNPTHLGISYIVSSFFIYVVDIIRKTESSVWQIVLYVICTVIITIGSLIYNEIIVIYCCNMNEYVGSEIYSRSENEMMNNMNEITVNCTQLI